METKTFKEIFLESDYVLYHDTYTSAVQEAERYVNSLGFNLDKEEMADEIGLGPGKPKPGKTVKHTLSLYKNGQPIKGKKKFHMQIYNRGQKFNTYELNAYIG
jgi:hypothetical protein